MWPSVSVLSPMRPKNAPDPTKMIPMSDFITSGAEPFPEIVKPIWDEINEIYGTDYEPTFKE